MQASSQLWKSDLNKLDMEAQLPKVPDSITSAASFACLETLGVMPPPEEGWLPRKVGEGQTTSDPEWWANIGDADWIYNGVQDKYFHLPTRSLWEKRDLLSCDPHVPACTYVRLDAMHLEALRHFATSMDGSIVPMVFQAWVRLIQKERRITKDRAVRQEAVLGGEQLPSALPPPPLLKESQEPGDTLNLGGPGAKAPSVELKDAVQMEPSPMTLVPPADPKGQVEKSSHPKSRRKKGFCFCVFARFGRSEQDEADTPEDTGASKLLPASDRTASTSAGSCAPLQGRGAKDGLPIVKGTDASQQQLQQSGEQLVLVGRATKEAPKPLSETVDLHLRRLEQFLNDVKKNPQRLVTHVEKRRAEKTGMAFMVSLAVRKALHRPMSLMTLLARSSNFY
eukprot:TRINITY_DN4278_c0_g1_i10.p1 TRINITY_DN4278_c0_g1~~TRINITY_DN4278_c0_g1_i10.p1  ORF type:complete len:395 (+),score=86.80 TRINITY_DN4278_c0_g1_i10:149-1333(+)